MTPSKYQKDVYDFALGGKGNASVEAVAGSGKTTTIIQVQKFLQPYERVLFAAFNKSVVNELQKKCPDFVRVSTMHSLGWRGLKNTFDLTEGQINNNKVWDWCELLFGKRQYKNRNHKYAYFANLVKICDLLRTNLGSTDTDVISLSDYHNINFIGSEVEDSIVLLNAVTCDLDQFDFTDMVYLPSIIKEIEFPKFDWIFVDEQQDLNLPQQIIIDKMKNRNTRVIGVGDRKQAIYGFAGADVRSFDNMSNKPNTIKLPLSICYRCAQSIVNEAKSIVPQIEWFESSPEGIVRTGEISEIANGDWVICRNTKPLVVLCLELIKTGKKAKILGKEIGKGITKILHRIGIRHKVVALKMLENEYNLMVLKYKQMGMEKPEFHPKVVAFKENTEIIRHVCDSCSDIPEAIKQIESIFDDAKTPITLSTIHKAKGLENDRVFFLRPDLIPSRFAVHAWQLEQEQNLKYVAITRAKKELVKVFNFDYDKR